MSNQQDKKQKNPNVPNLRFRFYDDYVPIFVGDCIKQKGRRAKGNELRYPAYSINNKTGFSVQQEQWGNASYTKLEKTGYKVIEYNDFAYNPARINVGSVGLYKKATPCIVSSLYVCFETKTNLNPDYLFKYLKSDLFNKKVLSTQEGGVRSYFFYDKLQKTKMYLPSLEEQKKVSFFLDLIDRRIETQNKIIEDLLALKNGLIRSVLWNNELTKTALGNLLKERNEKTKKQDQYTVLSSTSTGLFTQEEYFNRQVASANNVGYRVVKKGDIILSPQNLWLGNINYNEKYEIGMVSPSYRVFEVEGCNAIYLSLFLHTKRMKYLYGLCSEQGASVVRRNLNLDEFLEIAIPMPPIAVQESVAKKVVNIELKIKNEQRVLELFQYQKRFLLNGLFI